MIDMIQVPPDNQRVLLYSPRNQENH